MDRISIGIVGGGFTGSLLALHLLNRLPDARVYLIEKRPGFGTGLAYSTGNPHHLLNVRAGRMSAFHDDPSNFLRWLAEQGLDANPESFVPRHVFGAYVQGLLARQMWTEGCNRNLYLVPDEAVEMGFEGSGIILALASGRPLKLDAAVIATGNFPPENPPVDDAVRDVGRFLADPWDEDEVARQNPGNPLVIIGSGLTMVDFVLSLQDRGHTGPIQVVSRRGLLPHRHAEQGPPLDWASLPARQSALLHELRRRCGADWRAAVDGLRPHVQTIWSNWSEAERRRFLRHLRPWWDIHRHRLAPAVSDRVDALIAAGRLTVHQAKVLRIAMAGEAVSVDIRRRGTEQIDTLQAAAVVNCSGPGSNYRRIRDPLILSLLRGGLIQPDPLRLGLDVTNDLHTIAADGTAARMLFAAGPVTKGRFWEITAVPEIRRQCRDLADRIAAAMNRSPP